MRSRGWTLALAATAVFFAADAARAQLPDPPATAPPATTEDALHQMFDQAGIIFAGQVAAVRRINPANGATGVIEIDFAVDDAIRGVAGGSLYTLREWAGLAPLGNLPFQPGQRYLMLLHAPGPSGLSSPVGGPDGAIPIRGSGPAADPNTPDLGKSNPGASNPAATTNSAAARSPAHTTFKTASSTTTPANSSANTNPNTRTVDLRWIATRVLQPLAYLPDSVAIGAARLTPSNPTQPAESFATSPTAQPPNQSAAYAVILALLQSWKEDDNAR